MEGRGGEKREGEGFLTREHTVIVDKARDELGTGIEKTSIKIYQIWVSVPKIFDTVPVFEGKIR
ncbi:hypothetical protein Hanom_Chr02g00162671 [Helianthus anomalus]